MRIDLSDLERLDGFAEALSRLSWLLLAAAFLGAVLGSPGTGLFLLVLGSAAFVGRAGLEDFVRSRRDGADSGRDHEPEAVASAADPTEDPGITIYRAKPSRRGRRSKSAV